MVVERLLPFPATWPQSKPWLGLDDHRLEHFAGMNPAMLREHR